MRSTLAIVVGLIGAAILSQFPEYVQQYRQRVGGAQEELRLIVEDFRKDAIKFGLDEEQAIQRFSDSNDPFLAERGESMKSTLQRYSFLTEHYEALQTKKPFGTLIVFAKERDPIIARESYNDYEPAIPLTAEGASHATVGFLAGWLGIEAIGAFFGLFLGGRKSSSDADDEESRLLD